MHKFSSFELNYNNSNYYILIIQALILMEIYPYVCFSESKILFIVDLSHLNSFQKILFSSFIDQSDVLNVEYK